jgi:hypothetical protein
MIPAACRAGIQRGRQKRRIPPSRISRAYTRGRPPGPRRPSPEQMTSPRGSAQVSPSDPRARSCGRDRACTMVPSCSHPRTDACCHGAARRGRRPSRQPHGPAPGKQRTAGAAPGRRPVPCASVPRSPCVPRSAAAGPAPASPPPHSGSPADGAASASRATVAPTCKNPPRLPGGLSVTLFELGRSLHLVCHTCQASNMMFHAAARICCTRHKRGNCCTLSKTGLQVESRHRLQPHHSWAWPRV